MEGSYRPKDVQMNKACSVIRTIQAIMSPETLRMVYFAYTHTFNYEL